jgi:hypothetical protein
MSTFTKKHYEWFANRIGDGTLDLSIEQFEDLMVEFEDDNPRFKRDIFLKWVTRVGVPKVAERFKPYLVVDNTAT